jgi:hypothetical protein
MPPAFLNSREDALLLWALLILGYVFYKDPRGMASAFWDLGRAFLTPKLVLLFGAAAAYSAAVVFAAERIGAWHPSSLKETVYWVIGGGVVLVARAVDATPGFAYFREIVRKALALTVVVEFVANFYVFPLAIELPLVFLALVLMMLSVVPIGTNNVSTGVSVGVNRGLFGLGLVLLGAFVVRAILDPGGLFTEDTAERLLIVPILTLVLTPYLFAVAWYSRREMARLREQLGRRYLVGIEKT